MADAGAATPETPQAPETPQTSQPDFEAWEAAEDAIGTQDALVVSLDGFEGPLDVLLALARTQKVDLAKISVLALADQYLLFIAHAHKLRLELAADYLVMAAWLAYLKSRLLLPREAAADQPTGEELAARLAFRLKRLEAMRNAAAGLMTRKRLGRDIFARGMPEGMRTIRVRQYTAIIYGNELKGEFGNLVVNPGNLVSQPPGYLYRVIGQQNLFAGIQLPGKQLAWSSANMPGIGNPGQARQSLPALPTSAGWAGISPALVTVPAQSGSDTWRVIAD